jgi:hypothetical protein
MLKTKMLNPLENKKKWMAMTIMINVADAVHHLLGEIAS